MDKKLLGILVLVVLISFSGCAFVCADSGPTVVNMSTSEHDNNWYISLHIPKSTDVLYSSSTSKVISKKYTSKDWINETTATDTLKLLKTGKTTNNIQ